MVVIYPTLIAPLFNKFEPVKDAELENAIRGLAEKEGLRIKEIFQMDAGKRSRHTNAYFTGLGKTKRIVLYDTLLSSHPSDEILAVLAHEIGHLKLGHIKKQIMVVTIASFILFFASQRSWDGVSFIKVSVSLPCLSMSGSSSWASAGAHRIFPVPLSMSMSRRFEREADNYVYKILGDSGPFINALKKMASDNLSNLRPHPSMFVFTIPIRRLLKGLEGWKNVNETGAGRK